MGSVVTRISMRGSRLNTGIIAIGYLYWIILTLTYLFTSRIHWSSVLYYRFDMFRFIIATTLLTPIMIKLALDDESIVSFLLFVIVINVLIPMGVIYACTSGSHAYFLLVSLSLLVVSSFYQSKDTQIVSNYSDKDLHTARLINKTIIILSIAIEILTILLLYRERGLPSLDALDFSNVYEIRASYESASIVYKLYPLCTALINPLLFVLSASTDRKDGMLLSLGCQFIIYLWIALKSILFSIALMLFGYLLGTNRNRISLYLKGMTGIVSVTSLLEQFNTGTLNGFANTVYTWYSLIERRAIFTPAIIRQYYYDFFIIKKNSLSGLYGTIFAPLLTRFGSKYAYSNIPYSKVIGSIYGYGSNMNTGVFGKELAHFGILGIPVAALCLTIFLACVRKSERTNGAVFTCTLSLYLVVSFSDAGTMAIMTISPLLLASVVMLLFDYKIYILDTQRHSNEVILRQHAV